MILFAAGIAPLLAGTALKLLIPLAEVELIRLTGAMTVLSQYYGLFDLFFASLSPAMFCFIAAMVMLEERDEHMDHALFATPLGIRGYFITRIALPTLIAFLFTAVLLPLFQLSNYSVGEILLLSLAGTAQGIIIGLVILLLSSNKLEGMAVTKLSTVIMPGASAVYFVPAPITAGFHSFPHSGWGWECRPVLASSCCCQS